MTPIRAGLMYQSKIGVIHQSALREIRQNETIITTISVCAGRDTSVQHSVTNFKYNKNQSGMGVKHRRNIKRQTKMKSSTSLGWERYFNTTLLYKLHTIPPVCITL